MTTLSPSQASSTPGCGPIAVDIRPHLPQSAAHVPRSALPEPDLRGCPSHSPHTVSLTAVHALQTLNDHQLHKDAISLSTKGADLGSPGAAASTTELAHNACGSDIETVQDASKSSVDIITERNTVTYGDVKSASPRKPLPALWMPSLSSPTLATAQRARAHDGKQALSKDSPVSGGTIQGMRSSLAMGKAHAVRATFLTKEALDAIDADTGPPALPRSPNKIQQSPTKQPWNSPTVSPKMESLRRSTASPTKLSPPRTSQLGNHATADHRRAPSSIVSTGATSFHTAHGSPVRSFTCSQSSFSSAEDVYDDTRSDYLDDADIDDKQIDKLSRSGFDRNEGSNTSVPATQPSRIPRLSMSKGSTARAPTLSSTLKQTKSSQTLRSPKGLKGAANSSSMPNYKTNATKSSRHIRTLDSAGATPPLPDHDSCNLSIPASVVSVATIGLERASCAKDFDLSTSYTPSRATSTSTVKPTQTHCGSSLAGNVHSSDADDEYDDSTMSAPGSRHGIQDVACSKPPAALPDLYALDGYGIPWFYHMYPVPWLFPPTYAKGRPNSPKKLRARKQRSTPVEIQHGKHHKVPAVEMGKVESAAGVPTLQTDNAIRSAPACNSQGPYAVSVSIPLSNTTSFVKLSDDPFASQLDEVDRQASLQTSKSAVRLPQGDLTTIRNVIAHDLGPQSSVQGHHALPSRRRNHRQTGNGLYGGRGNVGVPLYATAPFPSPVPPMGRPTAEYVGYTASTKACGTIEIERAAELFGGQTCNTCEPDH